MTVELPKDAEGRESGEDGCDRIAMRDIASRIRNLMGESDA